MVFPESPTRKLYRKKIPEIVKMVPMVPGVIVRDFAEMLVRSQPVLSETWAEEGTPLLLCSGRNYNQKVNIICNIYPLL